MKKFLLLMSAVALMFTGCMDFQEPEQPSVNDIQLSSDYFEVDASGSWLSLTVTSDYSWAASSDVEWIVVETTKGDPGAVALYFSVEANQTTSPRQGTITVFSDDYNLSAEIVVSQAAGSEPETDEWVLLTDPSGNNAKGKFRGNDLISSLFGIDPYVEVEVNIYEHKSQPGYYKIEDPWTPSIALGFGDSSVEGGIATTHADFFIDASNPKEVVFAQQALGIDLGYGDMIVESGYPRYMDAAAGAGTLEQGVITFPTKGCIVAMPEYNSESAYYANTNGLFAIALPGYKLPHPCYITIGVGQVSQVYPDLASQYPDYSSFAYGLFGEDIVRAKFLICEKATLQSYIAQGMSEEGVILQYGTDLNDRLSELNGDGILEIASNLKPETTYYVLLWAENSYGKSAYTKQGVITASVSTEENPCQAEAAMVLPSEFNPELVAQYPDQTSLIVMMSGTDIASVSYYWNTTSTIATWEGTPEELVATYGAALSAQFIEKVNSESGLATVFSNLAADTEYALIAVFTNTYGESKTVVATKKTAAYEYTGELVIGQYYLSSVISTQSGERTYENIFTVVPNGDSTTEFLVSDLGLEDGNQHKFYANYDAAAGTFTVTGVYAGAESNGNIFGTVLYGTYGQDGYTIFAGESGTETIVFGVDPTTKALSSLQTDFEVAAFDSDSNYLGIFTAYMAATATVAPYTASTTSSVKPASVVKVPFSSVKINKLSVQKVDKFQTVKSAGVVSNGKKLSTKGIEIVKPQSTGGLARLKKSAISTIKVDAAKAIIKK